MGRKPLYTFDKTYFSIPNQDNCYWAGWIASDGCIQNRTRIGQVLELSIQQRDINILSAFKDCINYTGHIHIRKSKNPNWQDIAQLRINGVQDQFSTDLAAHFNIIPKKSLILKGPNITDNHLILYYLKGLIEGDGSVTTTNGSLRLSISSSSLQMIEWINRFTYSYFNCVGRLEYRGSKPNRLVFKAKDSFSICKELSILGTPAHLDRKWRVIDGF